MNLTPSRSSLFQSDRIQGFVFDGAMFLANFYWLDSFLRSPIEDFSDRAIGMLLAVGVLAQVAGVLLKKGPLQERLHGHQEAISQESEYFLGCLGFAHFLFFLIAAGMALALLGLVDLKESNTGREFLWFSASMTIAAVTSGTAFLAISGSPGKRRAKTWWPYQEMVGNVLLWISAYLLTRFFWDALLFESEPLTYIGFSPRALVLLLAASLLFVVFYVPARLLFLIEDYKYPGTWFRLWLVALFPLIAIVFFNVG